MKLRSLVLAVAAVATGASVISTSAFAQAKEQFMPVLSYRTGPYAPNGVPIANGIVDYYKLTNSTIPAEKYVFSGIDVDQVPALSLPKFVALGEATFLRPEDRVIGVSVSEEAKAYPLKILKYHFAVNDRLRDAPVLVTYTPEPTRTST